MLFFLLISLANAATIPLLESSFQDLNAQLMEEIATNLPGPKLAALLYSSKQLNNVLENLDYDSTSVVGSLKHRDYIDESSSKTRILYTRIEEINKIQPSKYPKLKQLYVKTDEPIIVPKLESLFDDFTSKFKLDKLEFFSSTDQRSTLLMSAADSGNLRLVKKLIGYSNVNFKRENGMNALAFAVLSRDLETVKFLYENGAQIDEKYYSVTKDSKYFKPTTLISPLMQAVAMNEYEIAEFLLEKGADPYYSAGDFDIFTIAKENF